MVWDGSLRPLGAKLLIQGFRAQGEDLVFRVHVSRGLGHTGLGCTV